MEKSIHGLKRLTGVSTCDLKNIEFRKHENGSVGNSDTWREKKIYCGSRE